MKVKSESEVAQSCPTPSNPMDCSLPGSSIHGIFQARVLEQGAIAFSIQLNTEFQRIARRDKKAFFNEQCIKIEENNKQVFSPSQKGKD